jgi:hypothetical protein
MTKKENERRNELIDKMYCAQIFGRVKGRKGHKRFECHPDFPWTKRMAAELKALDAKFNAKYPPKRLKTMVI